MGVIGVVVLLAGSILIARAIQRFLSSSNVPGPIGFERFVIAAGAAVGGFVASELSGRYGEWGFELDGLYVFPAAIGAVVIGLVVASVMHRFGARFPHHA